MIPDDRRLGQRWSREGYHARPAVEEDYGNVAELFEVVFGRPLERDEWTWKYWRNPSGPGRIQLAFQDGGPLVAVFAAIPAPGRVAGRPCTFLQALDVMTHPRFRGAMPGRKGILVNLAFDWGWHHLDPDEPLVMYGFPATRHAALGRLTMRYKELFRLHRWARALRPDPPVPSHDDGSEVVEVVTVGDAADQLRLRTEEVWASGIERSSTRVSWRYVERPGQPYTLLALVGPSGAWHGWWVLRVRNGVCYVVDRLVDPAVGRDGHARLLRATLQAARNQDADWVETWLPATDPCRDIVRSLGFQRVDTGWQTLNVRPFGGAGDLKTLTDTLYIQRGDSDHV